MRLLRFGTRRAGAQQPAPRPLSPRLQLVVIGIFAAMACFPGIYGLYATIRHRDAYPAGWQYGFDLILFGGLIVIALGLVRRRRWAARLSMTALYLVFFLVLVRMSLSYETQHATLSYWLLPAVLPLIGYSINLLRRLLTSLNSGW